MCGDCWKLGVTATPYRLNLRTFRSHFDKLIESIPINTFIKEGFLAQYDFLTDNPRSDLSHAIKAIKEKSSTGDYKIDTLMRVLNIEQHIQRLILCYEQYVKGQKGIVYAINKEHAKNICEAYRAIGVEAVYIDSDTPKRERKRIVDSFRKSEIKVMVNVDIFSEGFDCPDVEFIQLARPTWSLSKYLQQVGRGMRPSNNKQKTVILDNSRMYIKFGLPSEKRPWDQYFMGDYNLKSIQGREDSIKEKILYRLSFNEEDLMVRINETSVRIEYNIVSKENYDEPDDEEVEDNWITRIFGEANSKLKTIIVVILAIAIIVILIQTMGLLGAALIGLIAGFFSKK